MLKSSRANRFHPLHQTRLISNYSLYYEFLAFIGHQQKLDSDDTSRVGNILFMPWIYIQGSNSHMEGTYLMMILNYLNVR